jgi:nucleotide-binding universal stress UspA family protein
MYRTILLPLDGSERAEAILPHLEELALRYKAKVILIQVIETTHLLPVSDGGSMEAYQKALGELEKEATAYLSRLQEYFRKKGINADINICHGAVVEEIIKVAEKEKVDIIALASHGRTGLSRVFYGSVAAGILHRIDRPLLLVRSIGNQ